MGFFTILQRALADTSVQTGQSQKEIFLAWWQALRPPFLIVDLIPVGLAFAYTVRHNETVSWGLFLLVLLGCFMLHTLTNLANDVFDYFQDIDAGENIGGSRVIHERKISPRQITLVMLGLLVGVCGLGGVILLTSGQGILWLFLAIAIFSAIFYVAPPVKYGHRGYGELAVGINMGLIMVSGCAAVFAGFFDVRTLALGLPVGLMVAGILYYQSLPEIETDALAGKRTLAVHLGKVRAAFLLRLWWPAVWLLLLNLWVCGLAGLPVFLGLLTIPLYLKAVYLVDHADDPLAGVMGWLALDAYGYLIRLLYLLNGLALILGVLYA